MSVIIISSDSYKTGQEIAQSTARVLGYKELGREILGKVTGKHGLPEVKLTQALDEGPTFLGLSSKMCHRYLAYIQEATLSELLKDNVVCHGLAAHLYVLGVSHMLRVRVLSDPEKGAQQIASQGGLSLEKSKKFLDQRKKARRRWSMEAFQLDETDPSQYDLVISLSQIDSDEAVKIIAETLAYRRFQPMTYSIKCLQDLELASRVRAALLDRFPDVRVRANRGTLVIETTALRREKEKRAKAIKELACELPGVEYVEVHVINDIFRQAAESFR
jgi:Cytidylate kinase-like family